MNASEVIQGLQPLKKFPVFRVGDTLKVHVRILEGEKERTQVFEGTVIKKKRGGESASFTVRKISYGIGVERIFPFASSAIEKIEVVKKGRIRRARLYYLRARKGRDMKVADAIRIEDSNTEVSLATDSATLETVKTGDRENASATIT